MKRHMHHTRTQHKFTRREVLIILYTFHRDLITMLYLRGVSSHEDLDLLKHVPVVPQPSFWYEKKRKEIFLTLLEDFIPVGRFSLKCSRNKKSAAVHPPLRYVNH